MRPAGPLLLLLLAAASASAEHSPTTTEPADVNNATIILDNINGTVFIDSANHTVFVDNNNRTIILDDLLDGNDTIVDEDGEHEPIVRKKRTFGDIVFRGLADVLGYSVARKPPQVVFPPPVAPVPGLDAPLYVVHPAAIAIPAATQAAPAAPAAPVAAAPCGAGRAAPAPCRTAKPAPPPAPRAAPPCPRPRAAPRAKPKPKPKPKPAPPPAPPCPQPRANPTTPSPCAPAPAKQPPPAKQQADPNLETITSNFQLNFNFNRGPATQATTVADENEQPAPEQEEEQDEQEQLVPIAIQPQAAKLPVEEPRKPRVYVDAFVVRNGVPQRVDAVDAKRLDPQFIGDDGDDYLAYGDEEAQQEQDDYDDVQESQNQDKTIREFGNVVDRFWEKKKMMRRTQQMKSPSTPVNHYHSVHFGDRDLSDEIRLRGESHQSLQRERPKTNRIPLPIPEDDDAEATTTTEDPRKSLKPRVLPPTEQNPNQIDTITVRVPPIYKEKRPRKLHRDYYEPDRDDEDNETFNNYGESSREDTDGEDTSYYPLTERPIRRRRRRKHSRRTRSTDEKEEYKTDDEFDYFGKKVPVSDHEKYFMELTVPPPTRDADVLRHEKPVASGYFLEDHERLRDDPSQRLKDDPSQRLKDDPSHRIRDERERVDSSERIDERERVDEKERIRVDPEKAGDEGRADDRERTDELSPNARVTESNYENKYVRATNVQVDDPRPNPTALKRKKVKSGKA